MLAGVIHEQRGDFPNARSAAKLSGNPQIQYHLGMVSAQLGDKEAARQALAIAAAAPAPFPGQDEAKRALAALK